MAVVLGQKLVQDTKKFDDYAVGITLPIQSFKTAEQASSNIKNLLLTKRGERIMQPEFGSGLQELLFDFNDDELAGKIEETINNAVTTWLPYITIQQIDVEATNYDKDTNTVKVSIQFNVLGNANLNTVTFNVAA